MANYIIKFILTEQYVDQKTAQFMEKKPFSRKLTLCLTHMAGGKPSTDLLRCVPAFSLRMSHYAGKTFRLSQPWRNRHAVTATCFCTFPLRTHQHIMLAELGHTKQMAIEQNTFAFYKY
jgi:hypothetical protein